MTACKPLSKRHTAKRSKCQHTVCHQNSSRRPN